MSVTAEIDGCNAEVLFSGLAPGVFDVYQAKARVPAESRVGNGVEVRLRAAGTASNVVTMGVAD
jgi:uncharacterized protein (TIGR03437 family)